MHGEQAVGGRDPTARFGCCAPTATRSRVHPGRHGAVAPGRPLRLGSGRGGTQPGPRRHEALDRVAPQRDQELSGDRHDRHAPVPLTAAAGARHEPGGDVAAGLEAHPAPGKLDKAGTHDGVPGLADALLVLQPTAALRARGQAGERSDAYVGRGSRGITPPAPGPRWSPCPMQVSLSKAAAMS